MRDGRAYAEAAHIRSLGSSRGGADTIGNLLCLCANCHVLMDAAIRWIGGRGGRMPSRGRGGGPHPPGPRRRWDTILAILESGGSS
ncbi:HNH endonuclease [Streptomyces sp. AB3(2024)]|uniref:HNH endonuclease n=1 Tax=Streptomyces sp. AB3(2024) TaxID=3317321 RepID=UPI0035A39489